MCCVVVAPGVLVRWCCGAVEVFAAHAATCLVARFCFLRACQIVVLTVLSVPLYHMLVVFQ